MIAQLGLKSLSLLSHAVWSDSSLYAWRNFASLAIQNALSEDSGQTADAEWSESSLGVDVQGYLF